MILDWFIWFISFILEDCESEPWMRRASNCEEMSLSLICYRSVFFSTKTRQRWYCSYCSSWMSPAILAEKKLLLSQLATNLYFFMLSKFMIESLAVYGSVDWLICRSHVSSTTLALSWPCWSTRVWMNTNCLLCVISSSSLSV